MRLLAGPARSIPSPHLALFTMIALGAAGCSSDTARFNEGLFNSASRTAPPATQVAAAPPPRIEAQPLAQPAYAPPPPAQQAMAPPPSRPAYQPDVTGSVVSPGHGQWRWEGGTAVSAARGDTLQSLGQRHGVPAAAIAQANGLVPGAALYPGQRIVIPRYAQAGAPPARPAAAPPVAAASAPQPVTADSHVVAAGDTLMKLSRLYHKPVSAIAAANNMPLEAPLRIGTRLVIPGAQFAARPAPAAPQPKVAAAPPPPPPAATPHQKVASIEPTSSARMITPTPEKTRESRNDVASTETTSSTPSFRWPVRGRVIAGFGPKPTGQQNDGINLAVPEGTLVKASDDGVVAYAGNELKGYGNLVLIRHPNGYVTAYAHASELMVKRGDTIKRGQVIAKSGQTGNVSSPQLHFEIRKGASPVDPMQFLTGST